VTRRVTHVPPPTGDGIGAERKKARKGEQDAMSEQGNGRSEQNLGLVRTFYEGYQDHDMGKVRSVLAEDATWLIPGHHPLAGLKRGADEIVAYFDTIAGADFKAEVLSLSANEESVVDVHRGWGHHGDASVDIHWVLWYRIRDGKIAEVENFALDAHAADLFFWTVWGERLKPIPERLRDA